MGFSIACLLKRGDIFRAYYLALKLLAMIPFQCPKKWTPRNFNKSVWQYLPFFFPQRFLSSKIRILIFLKETFNVFGILKKIPLFPQFFIVLQQFKSSARILILLQENNQCIGLFLFTSAFFGVSFLQILIAYDQQLNQKNNFRQVSRW